DVHCTAEFRRLAQDLGWNDKALCSHYYKGLKESVQDILAQRKYRDLDFDSLANDSIEIDNLQYARALEKKENQRAGPVPPQTRRSNPSPSNPRLLFPTPNVSPNPPSTLEPMDLSQ
ncbi:hypothetical protein BGZ80_008973, partial [Entomortierella chlamydospora]